MSARYDAFSSGFFHSFNFFLLSSVATPLANLVHSLNAPFHALNEEELKRVSFEMPWIGRYGKPLLATSDVTSTPGNLIWTHALSKKASLANNFTPPYPYALRVAGFIALQTCVHCAEHVSGYTSSVVLGT